MAIVYFPFLGLCSLAYIKPHLVHVIFSFLYTNTQVFLHNIRAGSLNIFLLLSRSSHYSHRIAYFSCEHHCLLFISYLRKPKTEVTGPSEVDLVETITPVCSR